MGRKSVTDEKKWQIFGPLRILKTPTQIKIILNVSCNCVLNTRELFQETGGVSRCARSGSKRITTLREEIEL